jgi:NTP pyrophosphatase (non-canonical NTP hydrolase)
MNENTRQILLILQEECAEVIKEVSKCMRFGPDQIKPGTQQTNLQHLEAELGDVLAMIALLEEADIGVDGDNIQQATIEKFKKLGKWSTIKSQLIDQHSNK